MIGSIINAPLQKYERLVLSCKCGEKHSLSVKQFIILNDTSNGVNFYIKKFGTNAHFILDEHVKNLYAKNFLSKISKKIRSTHSTLSRASYSKCVEIAVKIKKDTDVLVAVGGDSVCQAAKFIANECGLPLIFVFVLPDGDDLLSARSILLDGNIKRTFSGKTPEIVFGDLSMTAGITESEMDSAISLIGRNLLLCLEAEFNSIASGRYLCQTLNSTIIAAAKTGFSASKENNKKTKIEKLIISLLKISAAKALDNNNSYNTSFVGLSNLLQTKVKISDGQMASVIFEITTQLFREYLRNFKVLSVPPSSLDADTILEDVFNIQSASPRIVPYDLDCIEANVEQLIAQIDIILKVTPLVSSSLEDKKIIKKEDFGDALFCVSSAYGNLGLIRYAFESGLITRQKVCI